MSRLAQTGLLNAKLLSSHLAATNAPQARATAMLKAKRSTLANLIGLYNNNATKESQAPEGM